MRAFIHRIDKKTGRDLLGTYPNGRVSNEYATFQTFKRYCLKNLERGYSYHVELFYNWDNRYGKPNEDFIYKAE